METIPNLIIQYAICFMCNVHVQLFPQWFLIESSFNLFANDIFLICTLLHAVIRYLLLGLMQKKWTLFSEWETNANICFERFSFFVLIWKIENTASSLSGKYLQSISIVFQLRFNLDWYIYLDGNVCAMFNVQSTYNK